MKYNLETDYEFAIAQGDSIIDILGEKGLLYFEKTDEDKFYFSWCQNNECGVFLTKDQMIAFSDEIKEYAKMP